MTDAAEGAVEATAQGDIRTVSSILAGTGTGSGLPPGTFSHSDTGNAQRFVLLFGDVVRYARDSKMWYIWEGDRWRLDEGGYAVLGLTLGVVEYMRTVEVGFLDADGAEALGRHALKSEAASAREKMLKLVPAELQVKMKESDLDANPRLLVVRNGTLDLLTGMLRQSQPADLCTRQAAVSYDPDADCPLWKSHIKLVTGGDPVLASYLQRACGYTLTGLVDEQKFWFLWGDGQNGKNVFAEALYGILGEYATLAPTGLLTSGANSHPTILADLRGARMVLADETGHEKINDARLKMLTGSMKIKARFMGKDFFEYDSTMKLWVLGNAKPSIKDQSEGTWRRMQLVPFTVRISDKDKKSNFGELLKAEWPGILNWCLDGLQAWRQLESLGTPQVVTQAVDAYRKEEDEIGQWLEDCCDPAEDHEFETVGRLYMSYQIWASAQGISSKDILKQVTWGRAITGRPYGTSKIGESVPTTVEGKKQRVRYGIKLTKTPVASGF